MYHRVLLKISGEALSSETAALCAETIDRTAATIAELHRRGVEIGIVVGGGNILRGRSASHMERNRADHMGMLATAINALALQDALEKLSVPCAVLSAIDMHRICAEYTARDAHRLLSEGVVVVFACGTGSPFFSTDTGASLRAAEIRADVLLLAKNIDAVYSADPRRDPSAVPYAHLTYDRVVAEHLQATDLTAITMCQEQHIPIHVFALDKILDVFDGKDMGTVIDDGLGVES